MEIISIDETRVVEVAEYVSRLNKINEHKCKACPTEYKNILLSFRKMINHSEDEVLICTNQNKILGVLALLVEQKEKYLEAVGGVYAEENYQEIAIKFYKYIKQKYEGFHFDAIYHQQNKEAICFMKYIGGKCVGIDLEMNLKKDNMHHVKNNKKVIQISEKYYETFCDFHNEFNPNVYWTGERILSSLDKFDVLIAIDENQKVIGSIVSLVYEHKKKEIYFLNIDKYHLRQGYAKSLLTKCIEDTFAHGVNEIMVVVEMNDNSIINLYESFGFQKGDATIAYSIESI